MSERKQEREAVEMVDASATQNIVAVPAAGDSVTTTLWTPDAPQTRWIQMGAVVLAVVAHMSAMATAKAIRPMAKPERIEMAVYVPPPPPPPDVPPPPPPDQPIKKKKVDVAKNDVPLPTPTPTPPPASETPPPPTPLTPIPINTELAAGSNVGVKTVATQEGVGDGKMPVPTPPPPTPKIAQENVGSENGTADEGIDFDPRAYNNQIFNMIDRQKRYPKKAQVMGQEGTVQVQFYLNAEGDIVEGPTVKKSSGFPELDDEAIRMIKATKFPPLKGIKKDKHMVVKKINFALVDAQ